MHIIRVRDAATVLQKIIDFTPGTELRFPLTLTAADTGAHRIQVELTRTDDLLYTGEGNIDLVSKGTNQASVNVSAVRLVVALSAATGSAVYRYPPDQMWVRCTLPAIQVSGGDTADSLRIVSARIGNVDIGPVHSEPELVPRETVSRRTGESWKPFDSFEWATGWGPGQRPGEPRIGWVLVWTAEYVARSTGARASVPLQFTCQ